jgi:pyruvate/2-oxoglutarate dehydrogenase complex dihydrolipoamide dehydrogenase (E3) component
LTYDIAVIGGGAAGLTVAAAAAQFGRKVVLFEKSRMGGDCLNHGCVPSKALIAAARCAHAVRRAERFGVIVPEPKIDFGRVIAHVDAAIAAIAPHDSQERFERMGVRVVRAEARFRDAATIEAGGEAFTARRIVIAAGSHPALPAIPGLSEVPFLTNETLFGNDVLPDHLAVVGGGAMGLEIAQAYRRLGSQVTVIEAAAPMAREDPELAGIVVDCLAREGVEVLAHSPPLRIERSAAGVTISLGGRGTLSASHLVVATGRTPDLAGLNLNAAGIQATTRGIVTDRGLRTGNRRIYAIGDAIDGPHFTHAAAYQAGLVIRNALFGLPVKHDAAGIPRVTYTDPELAQAGLTEAEARALHGDSTSVLRWPFHDNDRAVTEAATDGLIKVVVGRRGRILGVGIVGAEAGELIQPWVLAMANRLPIKSLATMICPYPTRGEAGRRAALAYFAPLATKPWLRHVIGLMDRLA